MTRLRPVIPALFPSLLLVLAWASISLSRDGSAVAAVWPVNAVVLAFFLRWARAPVERGFTLLMALVVLVAANLIGGSSLPMALAMSALNVAEVAIAGRLIRTRGSPLDSVRSFSTFVLGPVVGAPVVSAACVAALFALVDPSTDASAVFVRWALADGLGMAIVGAFLLTIARPGAGGADGRNLLVFAAAQSALLIVSVGIFFVAPKPPLFLVFPFLIAATASHRDLGGVTAMVLASTVAVIATLNGHGPAAVAGLAGVEQVQLMQVFLASMAFAVLPTSALLNRLDQKAQELEAARLKAEGLSEIRTRLLAHVSHEIRSPLAGVTSLAELMRDGALGELTTSQREMLGHIVASGAQVADLARDLTDAAALQSGKASVRLERVGVGEAISSAVTTARHRTAEYGGVIEMMETGGPGLTVLADPLRLRQILVNLLVNGAKYGGRPPVVRILAGVTPQGRIRFEVHDNGEGVSPARRERLFRDFERLGAEKTDLDGAGLGLALSQQIAQLQNGALGVEDGQLGGACFWLELPQWRAVNAAA